MKFVSWQAKDIGPFHKAELRGKKMVVLLVPYNNLCGPNLECSTLSPVARREGLSYGIPVTKKEKSLNGDPCWWGSKKQQRYG